MSESLRSHCQTVLAAILPDRLDLLETANRQLSQDHFLDPMLRNFYQMMCYYHEVSGGILTKGALDDILNKGKADIGTVSAYRETHDFLTELDRGEAAFLWSIQQILELTAERETSAALTQGMEILNHGARADDGSELRGHTDARTHVLTQFAEIDRDLSRQESPEGDLKDEGDEILKEYEARKQLRLTGQSDGYQFGLSVVDDLTGGLHSGDLGIVVGYTSAGKSALLVQLAWNAAINQGKNVVLATTETLRPQLRRKLVSRHSRLPQFGLDEGIDSHQLKRAQLNEHLEDVHQQVVTDLTTNENYGHIYIMQVPYKATIQEVESRLMRVQRKFDVDLLGVDYLQLLRAEQRRQSDREEQSSIVKAAKQLATTFNGGRGLCVVSPWQVNRTNRDYARRDKYYTLQALSETSEASNSPDMILSLLEPDDTSTRYVTLLSQVLKNRDGARTSSQTQPVRVDYATSFFVMASDASDSGDPLGGSRLSSGDALFAGD